MIQVENLSIAYQGRSLFEEALFSLQEGERCGLVGRNGSGKTTLFRLLAGREVPDKGSIVKAKGYTIGLLDQHIAFSQTTLIAEAALGLRPEDQGSLYKAEAVLFGLGFCDEDLERSPSDFSGGYQLRLHLAKLLIAEPRCLLLDEPTNYLDIVSIRWFTRFLRQWKGEFILISHDREFMDDVSTHTMGIHRQKIRKYKGSSIAFYERLLQEEEVHERTRQNQQKKRAHLQSFIDRFGAKATKAAQAQSRQKMLDRIPVLEKLKAIHHLDFQFKEAPFYSHKMVETREVAFSYTSTIPLIESLSLTIEKGERIAVIGKNGRGKSTLLRLLYGELTPASGMIKHADNTSIGYFGQTNIDRLHPHHTVEQEIATANPQLSITEVKGICGLMMFSGDQAAKKVSVLSGGEKSRVSLGKILASPCNLLLLDEPTHHLDMESIEALIDALEDFQGATVLVTHSELILKRMALDKIIVCREGGQELFLGSYEDFLEKDGWHDSNESGKSPKKNDESRQSKQQRTALITARSKALKPIDQQIANLEKLISTLEVEQQKAEADLLTASQQGRSQAIQELAKSTATRKKTLDGYYEELETFIIKREECMASFEV